MIVTMELNNHSFKFHFLNNSSLEKNSIYFTLSVAAVDKERCKFSASFWKISGDLGWDQKRLNNLKIEKVIVIHVNVISAIN